MNELIQYTLAIGGILSGLVAYFNHGLNRAKADSAYFDSATSVRKQQAADQRIKDRWDEPFTALTDCPNCGTIAVHPFRIILRGAQRTCNNCSQKWNQI